MPRRKQQKILPNRISAQQKHRACQRLLGCAVLLALSLTLPVMLTLRGRGSPDSTNDMDIKNKSNLQQSKYMAKTVGEEGGWNGVMKGMPSMPRSDLDIHVVFSTDCSPYQNYQSILLFHSAEMADQGPVTRVASGCRQEEEEELRAFMSKQPERFRVHFTPDYSLDVATGNQFKFYNKPNGMAHFLKYADPPVEETVIALVDPDMLFVNRLTPFVGDSEAMLWRDESSEFGPDWVVEGKPVAQLYGLGASWALWADLPDITKKLGINSPALQVSRDAAASRYPVGPPYMLHARDWTRIINLWVDMCPEVYSRHPSILAEMYGYCIAAAHIRLPHRISFGLMVSDRTMGGEGWPLVDPLGTEACDASIVEERRHQLPPILHYCQMYRVGTYFFGKRHKTHHKFFTCAADSLELPPSDYLASPMGLIRVHPGKKDSITALDSTRMGYMLCSILRGMNAAQAAYKRRYCAPEEISGGVRRFTDLSPRDLEIDKYG